MKIYLAGKFDDKDILHQQMEVLRNKAYVITHDWTTIEKAGDDSVKQRASAVLDIKGVQECDIMVAIMTDPEYSYIGTFTEIGCALGLNKHILIVCPNENSYCYNNIFFHHPNISIVNSWKDCLDTLDFTRNR